LLDIPHDPCRAKFQLTKPVGLNQDEGLREL